MSHLFCTYIFLLFLPCQWDDQIQNSSSCLFDTLVRLLNIIYRCKLGNNNILYSHFTNPIIYVLKISHCTRTVHVPLVFFFFKLHIFIVKFLDVCQDYSLYKIQKKSKLTTVFLNFFMFKDHMQFWRLLWKESKKINIRVGSSVENLH